MARVCTVCNHPDREAIDKALVDGAAYRDIAGRYGLSKSSVERHKAEHIPAAMAKAKEAADVVHGDNLLDQVKTLQTVTMNILARAYKTDDLRTALQAVGQARGNLELQGKLLGQLAEQQTTVNVLVMPEWLAVRKTLLAALAPYPDARLAVAAALVRLENGRSV